MVRRIFHVKSNTGSCRQDHVNTLHLPNIDAPIFNKRCPIIEVEHMSLLIHCFCWVTTGRNCHTVTLHITFDDRVVQLVQQNRNQEGNLSLLRSYNHYGHPNHSTTRACRDQEGKLTSGKLKIYAAFSTISIE
jgi:hypothetical protein